MSELKEMAIEALIETGSIVPCPIHSDEMLDNLDGSTNEEAKEILMGRAAAGELDATEGQVDAAIEAALSDYSDECGSCEKNRDD